MVYRTSADPSAGQLGADEDGPLLALVASGRRGRDGQDGYSGVDGSAYGTNGSEGGDAGPAMPGEQGGVITVTLRGDDAREAMVHVSGEIVTGASGAQRVDTEVQIREARRGGDLVLAARGGGGGDGGNGGRGGAGAHGRSGSDATRYSSGTDGGPGGNGGDGGNGTSGERGGDGGTIRVRVGEHDTPFLMLVREDVLGGPGGRSGANGLGGSGGLGGRGGSSYSWTETETYRDSNGNTQTRTTSHHNSGGSSGPPGRSGSSGRAHLRDGAEGAPGQFTIEVTGDDGAVRSYPSRYDLRLRSFRHRNENDDGIYEPEEVVHVSDIEVENVGGMPLPAHHDVVVRLVDDGWIAPVAEKHLVLPRALAPGERHVFANEELPLALRLFRPQHTGAPLAAPETIRLLAELPRVKRRFDAFETPENEAQGSIVVRFPIEVSPPTALFSLAPGQATRLRWRLSNVSEKSFGLRADVGRAIGVRLVLGGGEIGERGVHFLDDEERLVSLGSGFDRGVPYLEAKGALDFEGTIAMPADAVPYTSVRLVVSAELGHIADPARVRGVHYQEITVRVGRPFDARGADVLLIVNNRTNAPEVAAWESRLRESGLSVTIWDASLEGGVDVLRRTAAGEAKYPLAIVLDDAYDTPAGPRRASSFVDQDTTLALAQVGTHVLYVGEALDLASMLVPTSAEETEVTDVRTWFAWPWSKPKSKHLETRARALLAELARRHPERRYVVVHHFTPEVERKVAWLRRVKLGTLTVRRTLDAAAGAIHRVDAEAARVHDATFIDAPVTNDLVLRALPFEAKRRLLASEAAIPGVAVDDGCADPVVAAVLEALVREQTVLLAHGWRKKDLASALPLLRALLEDDLQAVTTERRVELLAWLDLVARDLLRLWEWLPPFTFLRRGPQLRRVVRKMLARVLDASTEEIRRAVATRRKALRASIKRRRKGFELKSSNGRDFAVDRLAARLTSRVTETDAEALPFEERVLERERHAKLVKKERQRAEKASQTLASAADARRELLRDETCEALLARAAPARIDVEVEVATADEAPSLEGSAAALADLR